MATVPNSSPSRDTPASCPDRSKSKPASDGPINQGVPMLVVYVGPSLDGVEIDGLDVVAEPNIPVDVPDDVAGRAPHGHRADEDFDPGEGLLAQSVNWQPA